MPRKQTELPYKGYMWLFKKSAYIEIREKLLKHGQGKKFYDFMADRNYPENTVKEWHNPKRNGPSDIGAVEALAEYYGRDVKEFLIKVRKIEENKDMNSINDDERAVARQLYAEMCDLLEWIEWEDNPIERFYHNPENDKTIKEPRFKHQEDARAYYKLSIRKTSLDLPVELREQLCDFVDEVFGDEDTEDVFLQYFNSQPYRDYLEENGWKDTDDTRYKYSATLKNHLSVKLDEIFKDYSRY